MNTVKLFVTNKNYGAVMGQVKEYGVKFYPTRRSIHDSRVGYSIELDESHSLVPFLILKYDLVKVGFDK
jgi:hypothetical protein